MAFKVGTGYVEVKGDYKSLDREIGGRGSQLTRRLAQAGKFGGAALAVGVAAGAKKAVGDASDLEESINKAGATFEKSAPQVQRWSKTTADALGLSRQAALESASSIGAMLKPMGVAPQKASDMSRRMVQLAADMASFNNEDPSEMLDRIRAGLSGESEPLKRYGTVLSETRVKQHAWKVGIAESGEELTEQQKIMGRYSLLLKDTKDQQGDFARTSESFANVQRRLKANLDDTSASIGKALLPAVKEGASVLNDLAGDISRVFSRNDLDFGQKIEKSLGMSKRAFAPYVKDLGQLLERGITEGIPAAAEAAAERAPRVASAFIRGFAGADEWGRLAIGAILLSKFGGLGAFRKLGMTGGAAMSAGLTAGLASGAAAGGAAGAATKGGALAGLLARLKGGAMRTGGLALGVVLADQVIQGLGREMDQRSGDWEKALDAFTKDTREGEEILGIGVKDVLGDYAGAAVLDLATNVDKAADSADNLKAALKGVAEGGKSISPTQAEKLRDAINQLDGVSEDAKKQMRDIVDVGADRAQKIRLIGNEFDRLRNGAVTNLKDMRKVTKDNLGDIEEIIGSGTRKGKEHIRDNFRAGAQWIRKNMSDGKGLTRAGMAEMERLMKVHSAQGKDGLKGNMDDIIAVISSTMTRGGSVTRTGLSMIRQAFITELRLYGLSAKQAIAEAKPGTNRWSGPEEGSRGPNRGQRGMYISTGAASGDSVPALLERGEYVLNREAVKKVGKQKLDEINYRMAPRFQRGGSTDLPGVSVSGTPSSLLSVAQGALDKSVLAAERHLREVAAHVKSLSGKQEGGLIGMQEGGAPLAGVTSRLLSKYGRAKPRKRKRLLKDLVDRIKAVGLPADLAEKIAQLSEFVEIAGDRAGRAASLTDEPGLAAAMAAAEAIYDAENRPFPGSEQQKVAAPFLGRVFGRTELDWLVAELSGLFQLRNRLLEAEPKVVAKRDSLVEWIASQRSFIGNAVNPSIASTKKRIKDKNQELRIWDSRIEQLQNAIGDEQGKTKPDRKKIRSLRSLLDEARGKRRAAKNDLGGFEAALKRQVGLKETLTETAIPEAEGKISDLSGLRGDLLGDLSEIQGPAGSMEILKRLPAMGVLGGSIFETQAAIRDLVAVPPTIEDPNTSSTSTDGTPEDEFAGIKAELLTQMLRESQQRFAVSQEQYKVLQGVPFAGAFADGGVVPGPVGAPRMALVHGGETITPPGDLPAPQVTINLAPGMEWLRQFIQVEAEGVNRRQARQAARALPGGGGGYLG